MTSPAAPKILRKQAPIRAQKKSPPKKPTFSPNTLKRIDAAILRNQKKSCEFVAKILEEQGIRIPGLVDAVCWRKGELGV